jgi:hypothetical protein
MTTTMVDLAAATAFMTTHARPLERRWFAHLTGTPDPDGVVAALDAHRNADGGYGWAIEPDLRASNSQPAGALHAFESLEALVPFTSGRSSTICDWLDAATLPDGGLPFALPVDDATGTAPFWAGADPTSSSLHITTAVVASAQRLARHDRAVREHPWLQRARAYCLGTIEAIDKAGHALELKYALQFLDAVHEVEPAAAAQMERLAGAIPASGTLHVDGGLEDESLRPLDFTPEPGRPLRGTFDPAVVADDLARLASLQQPDGGWVVDFTAYSPAAELDWRCLATVRAVTVLVANEWVERPTPK